MAAKSAVADDRSVTVVTPNPLVDQDLDSSEADPMRVILGLTRLIRLQQERILELESRLESG